MKDKEILDTTSGADSPDDIPNNED